MDTKMGAAQSHTNNFEPLSDVINEKECDTLLLYLPGFTKEHLRVQLLSTGYLRIRGSRPLGENKTSTFQKDFPIPRDCDSTKITAKFEGGILYVKQPKLASPEERVQTVPLPSPPLLSDTSLKPPSTKPQVEASPSIQAPKKESEQDKAHKATVGESKKESEQDKAHKANVGESKKESEQAKAHEATVGKSKKEEEKGVEPKVSEKTKPNSMGDDERKNDADKGAITNCDQGKKVSNGVSIGNAAERLKRARSKTNIIMALVLGFVLGLYLRNLIWGKNEGDM